MLRNASSRKQRYFDKDGWFLLDELHHSEIAHVKRMGTLKVFYVALIDYRRGFQKTIQSFMTWFLVV